MVYGEFSAAVGVVALLAGLLGSLTGLGGGIVIVPALTLLFGVNIYHAIGASLISVIATSSGAGIAYLKEGYTNVRVGILLEIATTLGACFGAWLVTRVSTHYIALILGVVLLSTVYTTLRPRVRREGEQEVDPLGSRLRLDSSYPSSQGMRPYTVRGVPLGFTLMTVAGTLSGLLGIGSGAMKVLAMDQAMRLPFKVSTATSNFMIGITAAASAMIYLHRGFVDPALVAPTMLGVLTGSLIGARIMPRIKTQALRWIFSLVTLGLGVEMILKGITGGV